MSKEDQKLINEQDPRGRNPRAVSREYFSARTQPVQFGMALLALVVLVYFLFVR
jgi:hypothetical protein